MHAQQFIAQPLAAKSAPRPQRADQMLLVLENLALCESLRAAASADQTGGAMSLVAPPPLP
jgi:hypothetical protein